MGDHIRVLGIAPYESMKNQMQALVREYPQIDLTLFVGDRETGLQIARQNFHGNYDVVISRGGTASILRDNLVLPVIEIELSPYDLISSLRLAGGLYSKTAVVCAENIAQNARRLQDLMELDITVFTYQNEDDVDKAIRQATSEQRILLCDMVAFAMARTRGLDAFLITSSPEDIRRAFDRAVVLCRSQVHLREENLFLRELLHHQIGYTVILDDSGNLYLSTMDSVSAELLEMFRREIPESIQVPERRIIRNMNGMMYIIRTRRISVGDSQYTAFFFDTRKTPAGVNHLGIRFFTRAEVEERYCKSVFSTSGIPESPQFEIESVLRSPAPVIFAGEDGTGKEAAVDLLYLQSPRRNRPLITVNCAALGSKEWDYLLEHHNSPLADEGSTISFTSIDTLSNERTQRLISVLQEMQVCTRNYVIFSCVSTPSGALSPVGRSVADSMCCMVRFLPPLRELSGRIPDMLKLFLSQLNTDIPEQILGMEPKAIQLIQQFPWPHNYSQFRRVLNDLARTATGRIITMEDVSAALRKEKHQSSFSRYSENDTAPLDLNRSMDDICADVARRVVLELSGNQTAAAKRLGISRTTLWRMLQEKQ